MTTGTRSARSDSARGLRLGSLDSILLHLWLADRAAFRHLHHAMGTQTGRYAVLALIGENPGTNQKALTGPIGLDKSTISVALAEQVRRGFVTRKRSQKDGRSSGLWLTPRGRKKLREYERVSSRVAAELARVIGRRRAAFLRVLQDIVTAFNE